VRILALYSALFSYPLYLCAQQPAPLGVVKGILLERDSGVAAGELSIRVSVSNQVYRFYFDQKTYAEKARQQIAISALHQGDAVEIVSDKGATPLVRYARIVHVLEESRPARPPGARGLYRLPRSPVDNLAPRGDITFSGIVARLSEERLVLRTRLDGEKIIVRRPDTRYLEGGAQVEAINLKTNTRVFVRAGKNLDDEIEAYQVIWGEILEPHRLQ